MNLNYKFIPILDNLSSHIDGKYHLLLSDKTEVNTDIVDLNCSRLLIDFITYVTDYTITYTDEDNTILTLVTNSDLAKTHKDIYLVLSKVLVESLSLHYYIENDKSEFQNINASQIFSIRRNIRYLCDWFGEYNKYWDFIPTLRTIDVALGYIQNQTTFLVNNINYRVNNI